MSVCARMHVCVCVCACMCACVCACVLVCGFMNICIPHERGVHSE